MTVHTVDDSGHRASVRLDGRQPEMPSGAEPANAVVAARRGAWLSLVGVALEVPLSVLHPHHAAPNDSRAAFHEYATSHHWVLIHLGQYAGMLLIVVGLVILADQLTPSRGLVGSCVQVSKVSAVVTAAVFAVQMAVDGVALKASVDAWVAASGGVDRVAAYQAAEAVRAVEKGLSALFHLNNAVTLAALGCAMVLYGRPWRWVGWLGLAAGVAFLVEAVVTALTGFSEQAGAVGLAPTVLLPAFLLAVVAGVGRRRIANLDPQASSPSKTGEMS